MALIALIRRRALPGGMPGQGGAVGARDLRGLAVLRRQHDHAGHLGAFGGRGRQGRGTVGVRSGHPHHGGDHHRPVPGSAAGHGRRGSDVRAGHERLVHRDRRARRAGHRHAPGDPEGAVAQLRPRLPVRPLRHRVLLLDRRRPGRHRSRGAVRGHGALRPHAGQARLAAGRLPRLHPELHGPGRPDPGPPGQHRQPVLPAGSGVGQAPDGLPRHRGDRHRLAGGHQRRLLGRAPGRATRLPAAAAHPVHLRTDDGPDLRPVDQLAAAGGRSRPRARVPDLGRAGLRLRHGRDRHDHDHDPAVLLLRPSSVAMAAVDRAGGRRRADRHRPAVLRRQPDQADPRSVVPAADRHRRVHHLHHLAARPRTRHAAAGPRRRAAPGVHRRNCTP